MGRELFDNYQRKKLAYAEDAYPLMEQKKDTWKTPGEARGSGTVSSLANQYAKEFVESFPQETEGLFDNLRNLAEKKLLAVGGESRGDAIKTYIFNMFKDAVKNSATPSSDQPEKFWNIVTAEGEEETESEVEVEVKVETEAEVEKEASQKERFFDRYWKNKIANKLPSTFNEKLQLYEYKAQTTGFQNTLDSIDHLTNPMEVAPEKLDEYGFGGWEEQHFHTLKQAVTDRINSGELTDYNQLMLSGEPMEPIMKKMQQLYQEYQSKFN